MNKPLTTVLAMCLASLVAIPAFGGLIGHWDFDEGAGTTAADSSANGNDATDAVGAGSWIAGKAGGAYNLPRFWTPANPAGLQPTGAVSVSAWAKPNAAQANWTCLAGFEGTGTNYDVYSLKVSSDASVGGQDHLQFLIPGGPNNCGSTDTLMNYSAATTDGWVHVVAVFDPGVSLSLYVNGSPDKSVPTTLASLPQKPAASFNMGRYANTGSYTYNGAIDDVQVYDQVLSADDVTFLYNNPGSVVGGGPPAEATILKPISVSTSITGDAGSSHLYLLDDNPGHAPAGLQRPVGTGVTLETGDLLSDALATLAELSGTGHAESWTRPISSGLPEFVFDLTGGGDTPVESILLWQYGNDGGGPNRVGNHTKDFRVILHTEAEGATFDFSTETADLDDVMDVIEQAATPFNVAQLFDFASVLNARYAAFRIDDNYGGEPGIIAGGDRYGLGEVRFVAPAAGAVIPEPSTFALAVLGLLGLGIFGRRRRKRAA